MTPTRNHWWHVTLRVTPRGLSTGLIPHRAGGFEIELDLVDHGLDVRTSEGGRARIALRDGLSVAAFHRALFEHLASFGVRPRILAKPYDVAFARKPFAQDEQHAAYDAESVAKYGAILRWNAAVLERFASRFKGKTSPVQVFWHSLDLAYTRFSGRRAPPIAGANAVTREAYSHEVASFGFWPGDDTTKKPAYYGYAAPVPEGLRKARLSPRAARWSPGSGMATLDYEAVRTSRDPARALLSFYDSVFHAARTRADWDAAQPHRLAAPSAG
jgi:hypothetical protein